MEQSMWGLTSRSLRHSDRIWRKFAGTIALTGYSPRRPLDAQHRKKLFL